MGQIGAFWGIADYQQVARWLPKVYRKVADLDVMCCIAGGNTVAKSSRGIAATKREQKGTTDHDGHQDRMVADLPALSANLSAKRKKIRKVVTI